MNPTTQAKFHSEILTLKKARGEQNKTDQSLYSVNLSKHSKIRKLSAFILKKVTADGATSVVSLISLRLLQFVNIAPLKMVAKTPSQQNAKNCILKNVRDLRTGVAPKDNDATSFTQSNQH